jgi:hypothetical protein
MGVWFGFGGRSLVFGLVRGTGAFTVVLPSFALVSRIPFTQHNHGFGHFFTATSCSRREAMVGDALTRASAFRVPLGQWVYHRVWIVLLPITLVDFSRIDLLFVVRYF